MIEIFRGRAIAGSKIIVLNNRMNIQLSQINHIFKSIAFR